MALHQALAAIGRVANLGKARGAVDAQPEAVLQAVRLMRAERDELRRRDAKHRQQEEHLQEQLEDHLALIKERGVIADATAILEDLVGGRAPHATLAERLREAVETTAMISAEMSSMQRQHASIAVLLKQEEANRQQAEEQLAEFQKRSAQLKEVEKGNFVLQVGRPRRFTPQTPTPRGFSDPIPPGRGGGSGDAVCTSRAFAGR